MLVTRNRIPDRVYESWNTQPVIVGSDSEADDDGSEMELLSDDSIGDDANHNPELASSLMEMELSDSGDFLADYKGKGKLKILKTPMVNGTSIPLSDSDDSINNYASSQTDSHSTLP
jgi:hypothetical protein